ncbi:MAG: bifunctional DNA-formamidopyrimidine glycosylase/DNA-(apurinic or apyrimidinic site) lyase [candidate division KSB1 bacterium]|nr:bifunctional DNA-formamidopyrimidine glycosylase/DNA-(apurinic or apyrimidinic site) lyase [candidate division KSB1 bacterium]MDZ7303915.1 bifunctional DNA-formamidopyrimidine glycosylase/DNA-(apurinic or apyrimidinic site) lyase [candidate division KSB1 bacterium]MDZ7313076.1 bifunctional DNA-formamidopyrimidine glycosylase/DNA-(apurinic or apyrimidinic site) lyase [candidate division KSB1 bacterium]
MPELPEVETIRRGLERVLIGKTVQQIRIRETRLRQPVNARKLRKWIAGQRVRALHRRAKYLLFEMENGAHLVLHLGMSGRVLFCEKTRPLQKHDHIRFLFSNGHELRFCDPRRFGMVDVVLPGKLKDYIHFLNLGIEPLSPECTAAYLQEAAQGLSRPIKNFLMDATIVAGVGNIYANEALFRAGIHPQKPCGRLRFRHWQSLMHAVRETLTLAIAAGGTTLNDFHNSDGEIGYFQQHLMVYGREGEPCHMCGSKIRRFVQTNRSSFYCPRCQKS